MRKTQHIAPFEDDGDRLLLDRGRVGVACGFDTGKHTSVEVKFFENQ